MSKPKTPIAVQQWINQLPSATKTVTQKSLYNMPMSMSMSTTSARFLARDSSVQSDDLGSHCSSIESVLEFRRSDPEEVLIGLGFGPANSINPVPRIPQRFLQPSKVLSQIDMDKFLEQQGQLNNYDKQFHSSPASPSRLRSNV